jgi:central kinetochore subunit Mal2/MCM21
MKALVEKYLPYPEKGDDNLKARPQDLGRFVRAVRRECVALGKRKEAVAGLKEGLGRAHGVGEVTSLDGEGKEVEIELLNKHIARVSIKMDGTIEKVVVKGGASVKGKAIERFILGGDGRIESLLARMSDGT